MEDTIVAIATPSGVGGIAIVRLSGQKSYELMRQVFSCGKVKNFEPRHAYLGLFDAKDLTDHCIMIYFKAPSSYTGEDVVEFQCHGGNVVAMKIVDRLTELGARIAQAGEFTKRAFLNGKVTLDEAEGVIDIINATSTAEARAGYELTNGALSSKIGALQDRLKNVAATIDVVMDYPDESVDDDANIDLSREIGEIRHEISHLLDGAKSGKIIKSGYRIALVGKPNAGKSSLFNNLLAYNRSIVTDISGTTRDTIEEAYEYRGIKFVIIDTAGVRSTDDTIERIGIDRSIDAINSCDLILFLIDGADSITKEDIDIYNIIKDKNYIIIVNKCDISDKCDVSQFNGEKLYLSAITGKGVDELKEKLYTLATSDMRQDTLALVNKRHISILFDAVKSCDAIIDKIKMGESADILSIEVDQLWQKLGQITGNCDRRDIIDEIFDKFCVGK